MIKQRGRHSGKIAESSALRVDAAPVTKTSLVRTGGCQMRMSSSNDTESPLLEETTQTFACSTGICRLENCESGDSKVLFFSDIAFPVNIKNDIYGLRGSVMSSIAIQWQDSMIAIQTDNIVLVGTMSPCRRTLVFNIAYQGGDFHNSLNLTTASDYEAVGNDSSPLFRAIITDVPVTSRMRRDSCFLDYTFLCSKISSVGVATVSPNENLSSVLYMRLSPLVRGRSLLAVITAVGECHIIHQSPSSSSPLTTFSLSQWSPFSNVSLSTTFYHECSRVGWNLFNISDLTKNNESAVSFILRFGIQVAQCVAWSSPFSISSSNQTQNQSLPSVVALAVGCLYGIHIYLWEPSTNTLNLAGVVGLSSSASTIQNYTSVSVVALEWLLNEPTIEDSAPRRLCIGYLNGSVTITNINFQISNPRLVASSHLEASFLWGRVSVVEMATAVVLPADDIPVTSLSASPFRQSFPSSATNFLAILKVNDAVVAVISPSSLEIILFSLSSLFVSRLTGMTWGCSMKYIDHCFYCVPLVVISTLDGRVFEWTLEPVTASCTLAATGPCEVHCVSAPNTALHCITTSPCGLYLLLARSSIADTSDDGELTTIGVMFHPLITNFTVNPKSDLNFKCWTSFIEFFFNQSTNRRCDVMGLIAASATNTILRRALDWYIDMQLDAVHLSGCRDESTNSWTKSRLQTMVALCAGLYINEKSGDENKNVPPKLKIMEQYNRFQIICLTHRLRSILYNVIAYCRECEENDASDNRESESQDFKKQRLSTKSLSYKDALQLKKQQQKQQKQQKAEGRSSAIKLSERAMLSALGMANFLSRSSDDVDQSLSRTVTKLFEHFVTNDSKVIHSCSICSLSVVPSYYNDVGFSVSLPLILSDLSFCSRGHPCQWCVMSFVSLPPSTTRMCASCLCVHGPDSHLLTQAIKMEELSTSECMLCGGPVVDFISSALLPQAL